MSFLGQTMRSAGCQDGSSSSEIDRRYGDDWIEVHATRWTALADACDACFDLSREALDDGALSLSLGGALSDVECAVALREAMTSASLLHQVFVEMDAIAAAEEKPEGHRERIRAARDALGAVEPGLILTSDAAKEEERLVFVRGRGFLDEEGQQEARRQMADSYRRAKEEIAE